MNETIYRLVPKLIGSRNAIMLGRVYHKLRSRLRGKHDEPFDVAIEIETHCNRGCWYCPQSLRKSANQQMPSTLFDLILRRLQDYGYDGALNFSIFNEPLLDPRFADFVLQSRIRLPKCRIIVNTNGDRLTVAMTGALIKAGVTKFIITEHPPANDAWRAKAYAISDAFPLHVKLQKLTPDRLRNVAGLIKNVAVTQKALTSPCSAPADVLVIRYNGDVGPCCCDYDRMVVLGNIRELSIAALLRHPDRVRLKEELSRGIRTLSICTNCNGGYNG